MDPVFYVLAMIMPGTTTDEIAVDDTGLVDECATTDFQIKPAFGDGSHSSPTDHIGPCRYFYPVAYGCDWVEQQTC